ncbi:MAG: 50S ribosomal protein L15 [Candidatus Falkowbacteria bacterium]|nr:50S ribosomal protein L15 [Candidatus Falkowbacteria bacterium]
MAFSLSTLKASVGASKKRKRVGRGNASGHGTYSTRGLKGQKSRSGVSGLKRLGMKKQLLAVPKKRGFASYKPKDQVVYFKNINASFVDGAHVNPKTLYAAGIVASATRRVKILSQGELKIKNLKFNNIYVSAVAKEKIEAASGLIK